MRTPSSPAPGDPPGETAEHPADDPPQAPPGPAHRWETAARTRVPRSLLLLAAGGLAALAWTVLGPSAPEGGDVLAELPAAPVTAPATGPASPPPSRGSAPVPAPGPSAPSSGPTAGNGALLVHVTGQVHRPGVVRLAPGARVVDAVESAGGLTAQARTAGINLAAPVTDGQQVLVPGPGDPPAPAPGAPGPAAPAGAEEDTVHAPLDLNTATAAELEQLPRVGPVLAERIVAFRDAHGGFGAVADLDAVEGIGPALMAALTPLVTV